jgi:hypothetical protein
MRKRCKKGIKIRKGPAQGDFFIVGYLKGKIETYETVESR